MNFAKNLFLLAFVLPLLYLTACNGSAAFDYSQAPGTLLRMPDTMFRNKTVAVVPFLDNRGALNSDETRADDAHVNTSGDHGSLCLALIPLLPAGYIEKGEPDRSSDFITISQFKFNPPQDLADAAFVSLNAAGMFKQVYRLNNKTAPQTDYIWRGKILNTNYKGYLYSYCITCIASPALWILGAPSATSFNELWVQFDLVETATGKTVWTYNFRGNDYIVHWIYARYNTDCSMYAKLMKTAMNRAIYELGEKFPK